MAFSEFTRNFELIELNHNPNDFYKFETLSTPMKFSAMKMRIKNKTKMTADSENNLFVKIKVPKSNKRSFSNFSIDQLIESSALNNEQRDRLMEIKSNLSNLEYVVGNANHLISKHFADLERRVASSYADMIVELDQSQASLNGELDNFNHKCLQNMYYQNLYWDELDEFIREHQICSEIILSNLDPSFDSEESEESLEQFNEFSLELDQRKSEFFHKVLMNKIIEFKPELSATFAMQTIRHGVPKCIDLDPEGVLTPQLNRLNDLVFSKDAIDTSNSFEFDAALLKSNIIPKYSIHSMDACQRILICNLYELSCTNIYLFDLFGSLIKQISIHHKVQCVHSNSNQVLVCYKDKIGYFLSLYSQELVRIKRIQILSSSVCCFFNDEKAYVMTSTIPFLKVYDKNLNSVTTLDYKLNGNNLINSIFVLGQLLFIQEKIPEQSSSGFSSTNCICQISVFNLSSGLIERIVQVPFDFDNFHVLTSNLILFYAGENPAAENANNGSMVAYCFDLSKRKIKHKVKFLKMHKDCVYCFTKDGLILTLDKNVVSVY